VDAGQTQKAKPRLAFQGALFPPALNIGSPSGVLIKPEKREEDVWQEMSNVYVDAFWIRRDPLSASSGCNALRLCRQM
jgi:hypothetical protein